MWRLDGFDNVSKEKITLEVPKSDLQIVTWSKCKCEAHNASLLINNFWTTPSMCIREFIKKNNKWVDEVYISKNEDLDPR